MDSLAIEEGSIKVGESFEFDAKTLEIKVASTKDSVEVCYRVLSPALTRTFYKRDVVNYEPSSIVRSGKEFPSVNNEPEEIFNLGGVSKYGAITRGISFGNRQNVFVNSTLNLQMDGQIAENLFVSAVVTDQNIPYQPEGNTQQIRDFDNVFIKLYNDNLAVTAGDIVLTNRGADDYFLQYYKNVQGLSVTSNRKAGKWDISNTVTGAVSKGKFASILVPSIEGLAGPYRLRGPNGERFIIVLANSERVFLDGQLMKRGFDQDYIIDYNLGEITFNNHIIITQFSRVRVDFEYAEQLYSRSNIAVSNEVKSEQLKIYSSYYRAADNPNSNFGFSLSEEDLGFLETLGDSLNQAFIVGVDSSVFNENQIQYRKLDTLDLGGNAVEIFQFSVDPTLELFSPTFSEVGFGNGDYVLRSSSANGRIYDWISPENGVRRGNYQPGAFIPLPNSQSMLNTGIEAKLNAHEMLKTELAVSSSDLNRYSSIDDNDNVGLGYFLNLESKDRASFIPLYKWNNRVALEYNTRDFTFIDRYRAIEFDRNWDLNTDTLSATRDLILWVESSLIKDPNSRVKYAYNLRDRGGAFRGSRNSLSLAQKLGRMHLKSENTYMQNDQVSFNSSWLQSKSEVKRAGKSLVPGYILEFDRNSLALADSVISTQMNFQSQTFYLESGDSTAGKFRTSYTLREDQAPREGELVDFIASRNFNFNYTKNSTKSNVLLDLNYRKIIGQVASVGNEEIIAGRFNWWSQFFDRNLTQNLSFTTGNGRELRREFVYLPVNNGEGTHTWRDTNEDGIQDLNEFFEAINPDERNFVKIFTPTDEYVTSFQTIYTHTVDLKAPSRWRNDGLLLSQLAKLALNVNLNVNYRTNAKSIADRLNPFGQEVDDVDLVAIADQKRYTLFYNRNRRGFAADFTRQTQENKQLLIQGFETRQRNTWQANLKFDLMNDFTLRVRSETGSQSNLSDFLNDRNFNLRLSEYEPQLIWIPTNSLRVLGSYALQQKENEFSESSAEASTIKRYNSELTWNRPGQGSLRATFSWVDIAFEGDVNSYLGYLLLDALLPGTNQTWQISWQQKVSKGMQLNLQYNGRKSQANRSIHTGSVQVTAFF